MGEGGGVPANIFCIYNFAFWGSYFWILQYTVTVDTSRGHSRQAFPQGRMKGTIEMTWYWIIQNVNVNSWESWYQCSKLNAQCSNASWPMVSVIMSNFVFAFELMCTIYARVLLHCIVLQWHNGMTYRNYGVPKYVFLKISHQPSNVSNFQWQWQNRLQIWEIWIFFCILAASISEDIDKKLK